jgi:hypothetical protein
VGQGKSAEAAADAPEEIAAILQRVIKEVHSPLSILSSRTETHCY